jgi:hypothetical protein
LKVQQFMSRKQIESSEDVNLQMQLFAYIVAKHYGISLVEVYTMPEEIFKQSLIWAMAINEKEEKEQRRQEMLSNSESGETVEFDYSFLESEDF